MWLFYRMSLAERAVDARCLAGMKKVTLIDIARAAGVSRSAVARVILGTGGDAVRVSEETSEKIQQMARRLGYSPNRLAQQLRGKASRTFGVLLDTGISGDE